MRCLERGFVVWLTGLPASGKSTIAQLAAARVREVGVRAEVLDGDWARSTISTDVGFSRDDRRRHLLRVAWVTRLLARNGVAVFAAFVSPYRDVRAEVRRIVEEEVPFFEVYVKVSLGEAVRRDPKGLYRRALAGEVKNFTGVDDPYEEPESPDLVLVNEGVPVEVSVGRLLGFLADLGVLPKF
ncbi:adenylyl-sulfate kinase [Pyrobaculum ferrireducens]|uniref:Adenylyl-sulfate kinase n=1 Tax=Pyrobaculum ferrireducens TaxID=1104324 RepID=G7VI35_9CREN|nr:adenylyl-sulfate kinase [Pyrobaculum ferrireducens]AET33395.1 Adenylyl-sulfate kinase [Pyrobaculum ferrireducens]